MWAELGNFLYASGPLAVRPANQEAIGNSLSPSPSAAICSQFAVSVDERRRLKKGCPWVTSLEVSDHAAMTERSGGKEG